ncbi:hypothetical protein [Streptomyces sp. SID161]|uniref:hypothetical protein n=1 Tax=Streptomyces sp. SID161 TaxID=2690251 RepID=UPI0013704A6A|nr:hypothetical protein [Streptomyces sp. SID161]MYW43043.1 hypothetical protein [Streptomyces sp. SID161]
MTAPVPDRVLTQNALTGVWLSTALPLIDLEYGDELNGPGSLSGRLAPRLVSSDPALVNPGNTFIYVESAGQIRWGGIIWDVRSSGNDYAIEAASWSSYLQHRYDVDGEHGGRGPYVYTDRCQVIRNIWAYAQSIADGNIGVTVDATTSTSKVGAPDDVYHSSWWENPCLGDQIDDLVGGDATPDYTCSTAWNTSKTDVVKRIRLGWPRLGRRRTDISFSSGVNIIEDPEIALAGDDYAQVVIATGSGDGSAKLRQISAVRNGRIRMEAVVDAPELNGNDTLKARASAERTWRQVLGSIDQITIRNTTAAPFGSWQIGDDVYTRVHNAWTDYTGWCRITGWSVKPTAQGGPQALISLKPAATFQYGGL